MSKDIAMILMNDFKAEPPAIRDAMAAAARRVIDSGWYVLGKECQAFEGRWASLCGTRHALGVGNGMDAIELAIRGLGIGPGDEVVTTPMTAFATVLAITRAGATPVLADIEPESGLLDPDSFRRCCSPRTRAVVLVHLYGQVRRMDDWLAACRDTGVALIEDCAQSHLASWQGRLAGSFGAAGAFSFYPTKNLGALGDGGAVVTDDDELASRIGRLRNYGQSERYFHPVLGMNSRLDEIQAALLAARLEWLPGFTRRRREVAQAYRQGLDHPLISLLAPPEADEAHVHHLFVVRCEARDALQAHLKTAGIQSLIHYPVPVHRQAPMLSAARDPKGLPNAERHAAECLSLPCHPQMDDAQVAQVIAAVNQFAAA
jgi:dTDP-4-amino-4,6-dideoxygalactose transaminase